MLTARPEPSQADQTPPYAHTSVTNADQPMPDAPHAQVVHQLEVVSEAPGIVGYIRNHNVGTPLSWEPRFASSALRKQCWFVPNECPEGMMLRLNRSRTTQETTLHRPQTRSTTRFTAHRKPLRRSLVFFLLFDVRNQPVLHNHLVIA